MSELATAINDLYDRVSDGLPSDAIDVVETVIEQLDSGFVRVAQPTAGDWVINDWVKKAILLYFRLKGLQSFSVGPYEWHDRIPLKRSFEQAGVRCVPPAVARYGSFVSSGVVLMPSYVNIGAWVGPNTMVDTWATVGSCAQIGADVHLSGGVGIGGVLEPLQASPVIVEDGAFLGSRAIVVEGVRIGREAVLGANVVLTGSTPIIDVTGEKAIETRGFVPPRSVVIPGTREKQFAAGGYGTPAALIIGRRQQSTDRKTSLNAALREHAVAV